MDAIENCGDCGTDKAKGKPSTFEPQRLKGAKEAKTKGKTFQVKPYFPNTKASREARQDHSTKSKI